MPGLARGAPLALLLWAGAAAANGRLPATTSIVTRPDDPRAFWLGVTYGLLISPDDGASLHWVCEAAIGYTGTYDPVYAAGGAGTLFAGIYDGLRVSRDGGCTWELGGGLDGQWIGDVQVASDGALFVATKSTGRDNDVLVSRDDGRTFAATGAGGADVYWQSLRVAPSDPRRVYVSGYRLSPAGDAPGSPTPVLFRSDDGGASWLDIPVVLPGANVLRLLGVSRLDPDLLFLTVPTAPPQSVLRSDDGGVALAVVDVLEGVVTGFASTVTAEGETFFVGGQRGEGALRRSDDGGLSFSACATEPLVGCLAAREDGTLYACGSNFAPDEMALGRSRDGCAGFERVLRFDEIDGPLECPAGTPQASVCAPLWPSVCRSVAACVPGADAPPDAGGGGGGDGCGCATGRPGRPVGTWIVLVLAVAGAARLRRPAAGRARGGRRLSPRSAARGSSAGRPGRRG